MDKTTSGQQMMTMYYSHNSYERVLYSTLYRVLIHSRKATFLKQVLVNALKDL
jgi:hypothetical protein